MWKYKRKIEEKLVITEEKMQEGKRRVASDESRWQAAKSQLINALRKQLKAKVLGKIVLFVRSEVWSESHDIMFDFQCNFFH
jgi:hypothetical protein